VGKSDIKAENWPEKNRSLVFYELQRRILSAYERRRWEERMELAIVKATRHAIAKANR